VRIDVLSLFPAIATAALCESMMKRAQDAGLFTFKSHDLRDWTHDQRRAAAPLPPCRNIPLCLHSTR
jgi:tRNA (guanine37-N1)-methyltransferase